MNIKTPTAPVLAVNAVLASMPLRLIVAGHVDHGKSTLVGRLLHETGSLAEGKFAAVEASCKKRGQKFEWAFVTDALQAERDQNVTIEAAHITLKAKNRDIVLIDAPGHREFLKNMITGAGSADAALLIIDAKEGISKETRTHAALFTLMGISQVVVIVNKMDTVKYDQKIFNAIKQDIAALGLTTKTIIPISAREGDNVTKPSAHMPWYKGEAVLAALESFSISVQTATAPLRLPVQDVYKSGDKRILVGRVESGSLRVGDMLLFSPANTKAKVSSIEIWNEKTSEARAGQSIGFTLGEPLFIERGQVASHEQDAPLITNLFRARIFWLGKTSLVTGENIGFKIGTLETPAEIRSDKPVAYGDIAEVTIRTRGQIAVDGHTLNRFVLVQENEIRGGGIVITEGLYDQRAAHAAAAKSKNISSEDFGITAKARARKNGHLGGVLWFTGLPGSGKSTIARLAQKKLFDLGCQVFVLDGDNIRQGLSRDLGFSAEERSENIRRVSEAASLFAQSGMIVITAFIAPYDEDREKARATLPENFHIVYVKALVDTCEKRDPKKLYEQARKGKIKDFTGVSAPYEEPQMPDLVLDTEHASAQACADALVLYITHHLIEPAKSLA